jgi:hypothetical protein
MRSIYSQAERVTAWLGDVPADEARETAILMRDLVLQNDSLRGPERVKWMLAHLSEEELIPLVEKFFISPYFKRLWCVQEVHLAKSVMVYYGAEEIDLSDINVPAHMLYTRERSAL